MIFLKSILNITNNSFVIKISIVIISVVFAYEFMRDSRMSDNWVAPYLSGAANLDIGGTFLVDSEEVHLFKILSPEKQDAYVFKESNNAAYYNHNPMGYAYLIKISNWLFRHVGHQRSVIFLQIVIFLLINILFFAIIEDRFKSFLFFLLFSINPIVLKFVVFNFYYFWQSLPSAVLLFLNIYKKNKNINITAKVIFLVLLSMLPLVLLTRPSTLVMIILLFFYSFLYFDFKKVFIVFTYLLFIFFSLNQSNEKSLWHTVYVGIGAYENEYQNLLSDEAGYSLYKQKTGEALNASFGGNFYRNEVIKRYDLVCKSEVLRIFNENPLLFFKNAILNTFIGFSFGYLNTQNYIINYIFFLFGVIIFIFLIKYKYYLYLVAILSSICTFTLFYPPIPAYMYGAYLINVFVYINIISKFWNSYSITK